MATAYTEFDTTVQKLLVDIGAAITASTDWSRIGSTSVLLTTSASASAGGTTLTFASTAGAGLAVGSMIAIEDAASASREYRVVTAMTGTTLTVAALTFAHASGTNIYSGNMIYKATTTRGADMIVDLNDTTAQSFFNLNMAAWRAHDGTTGTDRLARYLYWRTNATGAAITNPLHCVVSAGKEHLYISVEGPRGPESGAVSTTLGSYRNYFVLSDLVPYDVADTTPVVFCGGNPFAGLGSSFANGSHLGHVSRNRANTASWDPGRLVTLDWPRVNNSITPTTQRYTADGNYYLSPYVFASDADGWRGRLNKFFFGGYTHTTFADNVPVAMMGTTVTYGGSTYKLLGVDKGAGSQQSWNQFGANSNDSSSFPFSSVVVAIPTT